MKNVEIPIFGHGTRYSIWTAERTTSISGWEEPDAGHAGATTGGRIFHAVAGRRPHALSLLETPDGDSTLLTAKGPVPPRPVIDVFPYLLHGRSGRIQGGTYGKNSSRRVGREHIPGWNMAREQQGHGMPY